MASVKRNHSRRGDNEAPGSATGKAMAEIINLNRFRKQKLRQEKGARAGENRILHGTGRLAHREAIRELEKLRREVERHKLSKSDDSKPPLAG